MFKMWKDNAPINHQPKVGVEIKESKMLEARFKHYIVGIQEIDEEHFALFKIIDSFKEATKVNDLAKALKQKELFFINLDKHLATEERIMKEINYPFLAAHIKTHRELQRAFRFLPPGKISAYSYLAVEDELLKHIDDSDMQIGIHYKKFHNKV